MPIRVSLIIGSLIAAGACASSPSDTDGVDVRWELSPEAPQVGALFLSLEIRESDAPATGAAVQVHGLMTHPGMVPVLADAEEVAPGRYLARLDLTMAGDWVLLVEARLADGRPVRREMALPGVAPP